MDIHTNYEEECDGADIGEPGQRRSRGSRGGGRRGPAGPRARSAGRGHDHGRGGRPGRGGRGGRGARRASRGDVRAAILALLAEQPMHGYQMIAELDERTNGAWSPSPGSVYPTLQMLQDEGLLESTAEGGKKVFRLTAEGADAAAGVDPSPWDGAASDAGHSDLRHAARALTAAFQQVARTGSPEQVERGVVVLNDARKALYLILAEDLPNGG